MKFIALNIKSFYLFRIFFCIFLFCWLLTICALNAYAEPQSTDNSKKIWCQIPKRSAPTKITKVELDVSNCDIDSGDCVDTQVRYKGLIYNTGELICDPDISSCSFTSAPTDSPLKLDIKSFSCLGQ